MTEGISPDICGRLRDVLLRCGSFSNTREAETLFTDIRISPWRYKLPQADTKMSCVQTIISFLLPQSNDSGDNALLLFLYVLMDQCTPDDACHQQLARLAEDLTRELANPAVSRIVKPTSLPLGDQTKSVQQGLDALVELMQSLEVHTSVIMFRTDFEAAHKQIDILRDYKLLHDLLHNLQFQCYATIIREASRFPDDEFALENLMNYEFELQKIVTDLKHVVEQASFATAEVLWIEDLEKAHTTLKDALENLEAGTLKRTIWLLRRVLNVQPTQINTRLNAAAKALRLPALVEAMTQICKSLENPGLNPSKVQHFKQGVAALIELDQSLSMLVDTHDKWQAVDVELRRIEATIEQDTMDLEMSWPDLRAMTAPLYHEIADKWAASLERETQQLDSALSQGNPAQIKVCFRRYRRQADVRFYDVDLQLKRVCENLRQVGAPLNSVMQIVGV